MSIEKLSCCLAHPMTALRTLKNKVNEVVAGHNALVLKVENTPTGGGGATIFPINITVDMNSMVETEGGGMQFSGAADKSFAESMAALNSGLILQCYESVLTGGDLGATSILPLTTFTDSNMNFNLYLNGITVQIALSYSAAEGDLVFIHLTTI